MADDTAVNVILDREMRKGSFYEKIAWMSNCGLRVVGQSAVLDGFESERLKLPFALLSAPYHFEQFISAAQSRNMIAHDIKTLIYIQLGAKLVSLECAIVVRVT